MQVAFKWVVSLNPRSWWIRQGITFGIKVLDRTHKMLQPIHALAMPPRRTESIGRSALTRSLEETRVISIASEWVTPM